MNLRHATLHQLRIFLSVARHGSFARAAAAMHLSPPTLSLQVKQLSETVGQPLFEQLGKKIFLTAAGQTLAQAVASLGHVAEGVYSARTVVQRARALGVEMPISEGVVALLEGKLAPAQAVATLMGRDPKVEAL